MTTEQRTKTPGSDATPRPPIDAMTPARPRLRRSVLLFVLGALLLTAGLVVGWVMWTSKADSEVVAAARDVERGHIITAEDLETVRVGLDPSLRTVPGAELQDLVGQRAAADLTAGTLVSPDQLTDEVVPGVGMSVVSVPIPSGLVPTVPIRSGDTVRLVQIPAAGGEIAGSGITVTAELVNVSYGDPTTVVDVLIPADKASALAELAGTGRVALVLDSRAR